MWMAVVYVCMGSLPHDQCNAETAVDVIRPPQHFASQTRCMLNTMFAAAQTEYFLEDGSYPKVVCYQSS